MEVWYTFGKAREVPARILREIKNKKGNYLTDDEIVAELNLRQDVKSLPVSPLPVASAKGYHVANTSVPNYQPPTLPTTANTTMSSSFDIFANQLNQSIGDLSVFKDSIVYKGLDLKVLTNMIIASATTATSETIRIGDNEMRIEGPKWVSFAIMIGLMRGNNVENIIKHSAQDAASAILTVKNKLNIVSKSGGRNTAVTLDRVIKCFPETAYRMLLSGNGKVYWEGVPLVSSHTITFQMIPMAQFRDYAMHYLVVQQKLDRLFKGSASLKLLWLYLIAGYNSSQHPQAKRNDGHGIASVFTRADIDLSMPGDNQFLVAIEQKIMAGNPSAI